MMIELAPASLSLAQFADVAEGLGYWLLASTA
jgi:hypothetical protein